MSLLNNRYKILSELGKGGFGHTFLAEDTHLPSHRRCVIKQFKPANNDPNLLPHLKERFGREASILEEVGEEHGQIPRLYAYFVEDEQFYLVQELVDGQTLGQIVRSDGPLKSGHVREIVTSLLGILDYLHAKDIIHRDIKPDNIIYRKRDGKPVLIDFGTVKQTVTTVYDQGGAPTSLIIGSPGYMPMEQAVGLAVYASDLYSVGWTAIYLLTGKQPSEMVDRRTGQNRWQEFTPGIEHDLAIVIDRAVQKSSNDRYETAGEMLTALNPALPETISGPFVAPPVTVPSPQPEMVRPTLASPPPQTHDYARPQSAPVQPLLPQQKSRPLAAPAPQFAENDYLIPSADRLRISVFFLLIYLLTCVGSFVLSFPIFLVVIWSISGIAQALLLRKQIRPVAWIAATALGAFASFIFSSLARYGSFGLSAFIFISSLIVIVGIAQWIVLLSHVKHAKQWYLACVFAAIVLFFVTFAEIELRVSYLVRMNWILVGLMVGTAHAISLLYFRKKTIAS